MFHHFHHGHPAPVLSTDRFTSLYAYTPPLHLVSWRGQFRKRPAPLDWSTCVLHKTDPKNSRCLYSLLVSPGSLSLANRQWFGLGLSNPLARGHKPDLTQSLAPGEPHCTTAFIPLSLAAGSTAMYRTLSSAFFMSAREQKTERVC